MALDLRGLVLRALCGFAGSAFSGYLTFDLAGRGGLRPSGIGPTVFDPSWPASQCLSVGLIAALILALVRSGRASACLAVAVAWGALMLGQGLGAGGGARLLARPIWALALAGGFYLAALLFEALAREGYRAGKFLVTAPLVSGIYVAAAPIALAEAASGGNLVRDLLTFALIGLVIGNGTGFGVEAAEFFLPQPPEPSVPAEDPGN